MTRPLYNSAGEFDHEAWTGLSHDLYVRWMNESAAGTRSVSSTLEQEIRAFVFARDLKPAQLPAEE